MANVIRNSKAYDSGDVTVYINGVDVDVVEISYGTEQEHQLNKTLKNEATSWSQGFKTPSCTMTFMLHDIAAIELAAGGDLLSIRPFDVNVTFLNEYNVLINDTITCKFQDQGRDVTGDMGLNKQHTMFVLGIEFNNSENEN
ncbi:hypothetical protein KORDIASMS9_02676 [Kordia sp. SMS9]|uniref:hypothetical protein n=1 Tax=Kordia sp. SMS9 TaxID=2282170 RepID=UPI000E0D4241|nr:hypothetical protein [Kordia sp. SMS9]AXG70436.1 hypothetical protein KORDIASMS9_02676 [Kordia sp. SMS9]